MTEQLKAIKGELLRFLLTDDYGVGEAQCKRERVIQCANVPQHHEKRASDALDEMVRSTDVPVYSKGGGGRDVVQLNPSQLDQVRKLCNEWHPDRELGDSFDRTDLSDGPERVKAGVTVPYAQKGAAWHVLEEADVEFDHEDGALVEGVPADRLAFRVTGRLSIVEGVIEELVDSTSGDAEVAHPPQSNQAATSPAAK